MSATFVSDNIIELKTPSTTLRFQIRELPKEFIDWQLNSRIDSLERLLKGERITSFGPHLPVIVTSATGGEFSTNAAVKGVGLVPKEPYLEYYAEKFEKVEKEESQEERMKKGIELMIEFFKNPDKLDFRRFGSLEIFGGRTFKNILNDPRVTMHFMDFAKGWFVGYMVNCITQICGEGTPFHRFESSVRSPLLYAYFHLPIKKYFCAYSFWVCEVYDKKPGPRAGSRIV